MDYIDRTNFLQRGKFTYSFKMTNHLDSHKNQDQCLTTICEKISEYHGNIFPHWTRLQAQCRIIEITPGNKLFGLLHQSVTNKCNWLIFSRKNGKINVTHFGPFGSTKEQKFCQKVNETRDSLHMLKQKWLQLRSTAMPEDQKRNEENEIYKQIQKTFWMLTKAIEEQIEAKKRELKEFTENIFSSDVVNECIAHQINKISVNAGSVLVTTVLRLLVTATIEELQKVVGKMAAKQTVKQGVKAKLRVATKTTARAIPFIGLGLSTVFAIGRLVKRDVSGAGLEIASGAASCVPGIGTAFSAAVEAGLVAKDVMNAIRLAEEKRKALKVVVERIEKDLNDLFEKYETAKAEYDFVRKVGCDFEKLVQSRQLQKTVLLLFFVILLNIVIYYFSVILIF